LPPVIFRKGLDLKHEVAGVLADSYHSPLIRQIKADNYRYANGRLSLVLAREFGFCYGDCRSTGLSFTGNHPEG
jgi:4-hydroxy-3-methylbut-2-enyl diphosphate reductase